jgi:phosphoribosyl 1,2-cyclic phosphodiesterase
MRYEIIQTGSKGNAVLFNNSILVDCGIGFKKLMPFYKSLKIVLLTHIHGDHFNKATIRKLAEERPCLRFGTPSWLLREVLDCGVSKACIDVYDVGERYSYSGFEVVPFGLVHDVQNCGYKITADKETFVYATDTSYLPDIPNCDYYFIEANYLNTDALVERIKAKREAGEYIYEERLIDRHLSQEYAIDWLVRNGRADSQHVFLHEHINEEDKSE